MASEGGSERGRAPARRGSGTKGAQLGLLDGLVQLSFAVQGALERVADRHDLSVVQVRVLGILRDREPSMLELATFLGLDKSSVTGLITRAERRELVQRVDVPDDRRAVHVTLTSKGRELARAFAREVEGELAALVEGWSERDKKTLSELASRIALGEVNRRMPSFLPKPAERPGRPRK